MLAVLLVGMVTLAFGHSEDYGSNGYGSNGYGSVGFEAIGYKTSENATVDSVFEQSAAEPIALESETPVAMMAFDPIVAEEILASQGDGTFGYRVSLEHTWMNFADDQLDEDFKDFTGLGFVFGAFKAFRKEELVEVIAGAEMDVRLFWGNYTYKQDFEELNYSVLTTKLGVLLTIDLRMMVLARVNLGLFYLEAGPQIGFNILQTSMMDYQHTIGYEREDCAFMLFSIVPGIGVHLGNTDIGVRFVPDFNDFWKRSEANMMSVQFSMVLWR